MNDKILTVAAVLTIVFGIWAIPGVRVASDSPKSSKETIESSSLIPQTWSNTFRGLGGDSLSTLWIWPAEVVYAAGSRLGLSLGALQRALLLLALGFGVWGMKKLSNWWGVLIYLTSTYFLLLIDGGQLSLAVAYGLLPLCFYLFQQALHVASLKHILQFSLSAWALSIFDIRIIYLLLILIIINFFFELVQRKSVIVNHLKIGLVTGVILAGLHVYWLIPSVLSRSPSLPTGYSRGNQLSFLDFTTWKHALLLQSPHWPKNVFGQVGRPKKELILFPVLVAISVLWIKKDKVIPFWLAVAILGIFMAKGTGWPLGKVYSWLFMHMPGFSLFRDSTKFYFLTTLSFSVLIGTVMNRLEQKWKQIGILLALYVMFVTRPVWTGQMTGMFSTPRFHQDYLVMNSYLKEDQAEGKILWIPSRPPSGAVWPHHLSIDALDLISNRIIAGAIVGSYETMNWLRDATHSGQLLAISGVKYVIYPPLDPLRDEMKPDQVAYHQTFQSQLEATSWVKNVQQFGQLKILETKNHQDLFWVPEKTWFVVGSDEILGSGIDLVKEAVVFTEKTPGLLSKINKFPSAGIKLFRKSLMDVAAGLLQPEDFIFPASNLKSDPDDTGWWKRESQDFLWWRNFLQEKYTLDNLDLDFGGGWAISEGDNELAISNARFSPGNILLARVMTSPRGGEIEFWQNGTLLKSVSTVSSTNEKRVILHRGLDAIPDRFYEYQRADFGWVEIGEIGTGDIVIKTSGEINVLNAFGVVEKVRWKTLIGRAAELITLPSATTSNTSVTYDKIAATEYKVRILEKDPAVLVFSQNFDPLWTVNGHGSIEAYGLLNAFPLQGEGEYIVYFQPQKYVWMQKIWDILK